MQPTFQWRSSKYYIFWVWVVALGIQNAMCMLSSTIFLHIISQMAWFSKNIIEHEMCVLIFSTIFVWNISCSKKKWARYDKQCISVFTYNTPYTCQIIIIKTWIFSTNFQKIFKYQTSWKISLVGAELLQADRGTDKQMDRHAERRNKAVTFCNFANAPKNGSTVNPPPDLR
jgi:K+-sensing histidine kinase KdpD